VDKSVKYVDNGCRIIYGGYSAMSDDKTNSPFKNSLYYLALMHVLDEIRSDDNTHFAMEHFNNDPRLPENKGERFLHYLESGRFHKALSEFRDSRPDLRRDSVHKPKLQEDEAIAA
jgi:hypothetical protein